MASREEILSEICRTAASNGRPIGRGRFRELTGISDYAIAQHWANYSEAVREAGFEPNTLQRPIDQQAVIRRLMTRADRELADVCSTFSVHQIEEKFGTLRLCVEFDGDDDLPARLRAAEPRCPSFRDLAESLVMKDAAR